MKTRTVWFGVPVIVVRGVVLVSGLFAVIFVGGSWLLIFGLEQEWVSMEMLIDRPWLSWVLFLFPIGTMVFVWVLMPRFLDPITRFQKLNGRMCFVCGYEIGEGLEMCSECGARWSLDDLNRGWRKIAEGKDGENTKEGG